MSIIVPPWTDSQVRMLGVYQTLDAFHPYTCGGLDCLASLIPTEDGWTCPDCDYVQMWAHAFSAGPWETP